MPVYLPSDTRETLPNPSGTCSNRSLLLDRYADPAAKEEDRVKFFRSVIGKTVNPCKRDAWQQFLLNAIGMKPEEILLGKLQSRLMVNMAGGVMENAGLCLDRLTGMPYVPGAAVKGCARSMAIQEMRETESTDAKTKLLEFAALIFGWGNTDWKDGRGRGRHGTPGGLNSDFEYACGEGQPWRRIRDSAAAALAARLKVKLKKSNPVWSQLPNFAGAVSFLPAYPRVSPVPDLELDVVTPHHQKYYGANAELEMPVALDTENPIPVVFPAVAAGHIFAFAVIGKDRDLVQKAREWLRGGLQIFGIGAKTAAGYGWFDCSTGVTSEVSAVASTEQERKKHEPIGDFNEVSFRNAVLNRLFKKGEWQQLQKEVEKLMRPGNKEWLDKFRGATAGKDHKELRAKEWYPK